MTALTLALALSACNSIENQHDPSETRDGILQHHPGTATAVPPGSEIEAVHDAVPPPRPVYINLHVFGLSYHPDREGTRISHLDNEFNFGLGLGHTFYEDNIGVVASEVGFFKDSGRTWAKFAGAGYHFKLTDHLKFGVNLLAIQSPTYNLGDPFIAPIPQLTYDFSRVKISMVYIPRYKDLNYFAVYALYFTIPIWK